jgi:PIN domain nuclease of toxin-antitoxin system
MEFETTKLARLKFDRKGERMLKRLEEAGMAFGLFDCVAGDTRVLTDGGWKVITAVTVADRVWDGSAWVTHDGVIRKGTRDTISLGGVGITPDHEVLMGEAWVSASEADLEVLRKPSGFSFHTNNHGGMQDVYDILNAGPDHRFTVAVSDCYQMIISNCDCACAAPPNYQPTADATTESAQIMADLGQAQLAESQRQYDTTLAVSKPVVDAQLGIMQQTSDQGSDYYDYMKSTFRPLEQSAALEAMGLTPTQIAQYNALKAQEEASAAQGAQIDTSRSDAFLADASANAGLQRQEEKAGKAIADVRSGWTSATNMAMRQGLRYGLSPEQIAARAVDSSTGLASAEVAAANDARLKEEATGWAKKLDVAGIGRGLPGASAGAYSLAVGAGDSAVKNTMAPGAALLAGNAAGVGTIGAGQQLNMQGNLGILNAQTSYANAQNDAMSGGGSMGGLGSLLGGAAAAFSSKKIKKNKQDISPVLNGIKKLNVQQWDYKEGEGDGGTHVGPYAEDVNQEFGEQAAPGGKAVDIISMMGINLKATQELAAKVDNIERKLPRNKEKAHGETA